MLDNSILGYSAVKTEEYSTTREKNTGDSLFVGTQDIVMSGVPSRSSVIKTTDLSDGSIGGCAVDCAPEKLLNGVQVKWFKPDPLGTTPDSATDYANLNAAQFIQIVEYLTGITIDSTAFLANASAPFFQIDGRES